MKYNFKHCFVVKSMIHWCLLTPFVTGYSVIFSIYTNFFCAFCSAIQWKEDLYCRSRYVCNCFIWCSADASKTNVFLNLVCNAFISNVTSVYKYLMYISTKEEDCWRFLEDAMGTGMWSYHHVDWTSGKQRCEFTQL